MAGEPPATKLPSRGAPPNRAVPTARGGTVRSPPPVSAAWRPGDPPGRRQFLQLPSDRSLALEGGGALRDVTIAYETWGTLDSTGGNAILVCHAWTGDSHVAGPIGPGHPTGGWWEGMVGPGMALDTDRYFVVCSNVHRRLPGLDRPDLDRPGHGHRVRTALPGGHHPRHGAGPGSAGDAPRRAGVVQRDRRLDGRHAGARVGDHLPRPGPLAHPGGYDGAGHRPADRLERRRPPRRAARPRLSGRATTTTPSPARAPTRAWPSPGCWPR